ncbi:hypothetical protein A3G67_04175 [Candidatus Roizmanbacteria bacterium RIFCSPLOWO2_12_FULL_40_12]|uniref:Aspartyl/glutamyl-tRNA(Asn/Gln) amidotransferase subunit B n=1 Tax=Candidatus Roizmanbacteria bacterium RIFCSPLOWO2_01_FULL_40_42 TaxID=1802066 RepID=A0A1F7J6S6_9BACT|nr:MAG: hypothetical protein A2779_00715 [Candidatus Roizmanbacteria bacterium RIFCSPHIGHO2_01_FULL_40_98]OGK29182.1 MAG: hypothetical protein A3C31_02690 [Candidatus Roizmanbacteria bacterium RIFCSPHIGHO2_02_FULL_40_53]OGK30883.1 MAG: hypothetical protein A2W49_01740 [Candidatus Roizmanbacteria bacterium RIFCSPHIGHO2_12_41_18]OGK37219.1 MAG: hypothetical protein A3E69_01900 [Candidatus Roizmanbacteria bacterium RIFCSPHIGHO2_12_FULL_40_130]OGK51293.1 MAG: hypothetical protein A3B50_04775 [Candi
MKDYVPVIGLEIHVELSTKSKMFCQCSADFFGKRPNSLVCPVCLGLPGALPVPNKKAVEWTVKIGKALNCKINPESKFDRKHYFYPDLPKGYQISQYDEPIAVGGFLEANKKKFRIHRVHLEEDTGKLTHEGKDSLVDFNRSGVPLVEIVTEPDFTNSEDVVAFLKELHTIIKEYLQVSDANMDQGSMRLEPNISIKKVDDKNLPNYKVEVKNINSFNFVKRAIEFELKRQLELLQKGETPIQETRGFNEKKGITVPQRTKEGAEDYRYFPEPDIPPLSFTQKYVEEVEIPELPAQKTKRYEKNYNLREHDAFILTRDGKMATYFEKVMEEIRDKAKGQKVANLIINKKIDSTASVKELTEKLKDQSEGRKTDLGSLESAIVAVLEGHPKEIKEYQSGKENIIMFFVGQVMREMKGQANPQVVKQELEKKLKK